MGEIAGPLPDHECWWKNLADGLAATLADLDSDSALSALRQMLRAEKQRRRAAEQRVAELEHKLRQVS
jgi:hypothetical protein